MKRLFAILLAALMIMSVLAACKSSKKTGGTDNSATAATTSDTSSAETTASGTQEPSLPTTTASGAAEPPPTTETGGPADAMEVLINGYLDLIVGNTLMSEIADYEEHEHRLIRAHQKEFDAIVALGQAALPVLDKMIRTIQKESWELYQQNREHYYEKYSFLDVREIIMCQAVYSLDPGRYNKSSTSPDGKIMLIATVHSLFPHVYGQIYWEYIIVDVESGETLFTVEIESGDIDMYWSPDGQYAAVSYRQGRWYYVEIIGVEQKRLLNLPSRFDLIEATGNSVYDLIVMYWFGKWNGNGTAEVVFDSFPLDHGFSGSYIFDLANESIVSVSHEFYDYREDNENN